MTPRERGDVGSSLAGATLVCGSILLVAGSALPTGPELLLAAADNLLLACAILAFAGAAMTAAAALVAPTASPAAIVVAMKVGAPLLCAGVTFVRYGEWFRPEMAVAIAIGLTASALIEALARGGHIEAPPFTNAEKSRRLPLGLALALAACFLLRWLQPGTPFLFVVAALVVTFGPGLALGRLLQAGEPLPQRLLYAPALSLGALVIVLLWLDFLGIPATPAVLSTALAGLIVLPLAASLMKRAG